MTAVDIPRLGIDRYLRSPWARRLTLLLFILSAAIAIFVLPNHPPAPYRIDFDVYRMGGRVFLDDGDLYGKFPILGGGSYLPFTYPPLAAALFSAFTVVPLGVGQALFTALSIACLLVVCRIVVAHLTDRPSAELWWLATAATTVGLWLEPVRDTLNFGQINIVLMALVVVDALLGRGRWWRGLLVGLAISIKLTPAVFLLLFLLRRDWRALAVSAVSAVVYTGIGHLLAADDSVTYWTSTLYDTERIGSPQFANNQSIKGELARLGIESEIVWFGAALAVGLLIAWSAWRLLSASELAETGRDEAVEVAAVLTVAFAWLFCSPVAWDHSWVWIVTLLMVLIALGARSGAMRIWWWLTGTGLAVFAYAAHQHVPQRYDAELSWTWWQHVAGSSYLIWGLVVIVTLGVLAPRLTSTPSPETQPLPAA